MRSGIFATAILAAVSAASAATVEKRQSDNSTEVAAPATALTDGDILNFALILEHLEATFYAQAISRFNESAFTAAGYPANVYNNFKVIAGDEAQHVEFLTSALTAAGVTPVKACEYDFPGADTVTGFLGLSQVLEGVGVSAYLGAAQYINNTAYLTAAGSILTAEARHSAFARLVNGYSPFVMEDTPQSPTAVTSMAAAFFKSCPDGSSPPFKPFPGATLKSTNVTFGSDIEIALTNGTAPDPAYCIFFSGLSQFSSEYKNGTCTAPTTANAQPGQAYAVISFSQNYTDSAVIGGPVILQFDQKNASIFGASIEKGVTADAAIAKDSSASERAIVLSALGTLAISVGAAFAHGTLF